uniref:Acyltransferase 3 domain-containing protein n=1 Tax=Anopheles atroparvus TaxID=41427 RepID=A0A182IXD2_ANOAO
MVHGATQFNMSQYRLMPRVFQFDDYDECLRDDPTVPGVYCMVKAVVQPDESSSVWNVIAEYSSNWKQHLNHAHLDRGLCLQTCTQKLAELERQNVTQEELDALVVPKFQIDFPCLRDDPTVPGVYCMVKAVVQPDESSSVWNVIAEYSSNWKQHLNHAHLDRGLCLQTCTQKLAELERQNVTQEELDALVVPKFEIDFPYIIKNGSFRDVDEYRRNYSDTFAKCINYDLQREHGLRAYTEIEYCDNNTKSYPIASMVCVSFSIIRNWYRLTSRGEDALSHSIRYVHAIRFVIFMMINMGHNILYAQPRTARVIEQCMQHTWYLAADFHMFIYGLMVCAVVLRYPKFRNYILSFLLLLWSMIAAIIVYVNEYEAVTILPPEPLRFFYWYWDMYHDTYLPTHMNLVNYTAAIMGSFYILHLQKKNFKTPKMFSLLWLLGVLAIPGSFVAGYFLYSNLFETPSAWMALVFPLGRIFYTALLFFLTVGFIFRASKPVLRLLNIHFFGILGRLTYCAYLCHFFITRAAAFGTRRSINLGVFEMNSSSWSTLVMSYVLGWMLCLMLESPFISLQKVLFESLHGKRKTGPPSSGHRETPANFVGIRTADEKKQTDAESARDSPEQEKF